MAAPPSSGAVLVAPDALGPARAGPVSSGGLARRWRVLVCTPAAERSCLPPRAPSVVRGWGGGGETGPGPSPQQRGPVLDPPEPATRSDLVAAGAPIP